MKNIISTQPYKGTVDWYPEDFKIQKYIFDTWRKVCRNFGFKEYLTPLLESSDVYKAKSGVVKDELFVLTDRAQRELALRPEMTPSVTRMVSAKYKETPKPIKLFSIANFFRNEAPQKGRQREFWQLNADIFGDSSINSDIEVLSLAVEIMLAFNAPKNSFKLYFSNRVLLDDLFSAYVDVEDEKKLQVSKIMDKYDKISKTETLQNLQELGLTVDQIDRLMLFLNSDSSTLLQNFPELVEKEGFKQISFVNNALNELGYADYVEFKPSIIRGLDYYNGTVFEVYDLNKSNPRSLYGGGRYNGLSNIFGVEDFPATGFAPGNVTTQLFLENWGLYTKNQNSNFYYCPIINQDNYVKVLKMANLLRRQGLEIETDISKKSLSDCMRYANKQGYEQLLIIEEQEILNNQVTIKNMITGTQETKSFEKFLTEII